jgi:RecA-family ATPase
LKFAIEGFLQEAGVTLIGGLAGHGKTLLMLAMAKALLEESPLFGYELFSVPRPALRVLYLIPESSLGPFRSRLELFRLREHVRGDRLLVSTLSSRDPVSLSDPRMLKAAEGADVFLDTAIRFMEGSENDAQDTRPFVQTLFRLLHAGARSITGAHHAPKGFEGQNFMTLENILRGSGDIGAMLSTAWGVRQVGRIPHCALCAECQAAGFSAVCAFHHRRQTAPR